MTTEIETKFNLTTHDFIVLMSQASHRATKIHTDYYYDTPGYRLFWGDWCCRIRKSFDDCELTIKYPSTHRIPPGVTPENPSAMTREEVNIKWYGPIPNVLHPREFFPIYVQDKLEHTNALEMLVYAGQTSNHRKILTLDGILTFELDSVTLPNGSMYHEVEIETVYHESRTKIFRQIQEILPGIQVTDDTKYARLVRSLNGEKSSWKH